MHSLLCVPRRIGWLQKKMTEGLELTLELNTNSQFGVKGNKREEGRVLSPEERGR